MILRLIALRFLSLSLYRLTIFTFTISLLFLIIYYTRTYSNSYILERDEQDSSVSLERLN